MDSKFPDSLFKSDAIVSYTNESQRWFIVVDHRTYSKQTLADQISSAIRCEYGIIIEVDCTDSKYLVGYFRTAEWSEREKLHETLELWGIQFKYIKAVLDSGKLSVIIRQEDPYRIMFGYKVKSELKRKALMNAPPVAGETLEANDQISLHISDHSLKNKPEYENTLILNGKILFLDSLDHSLHYELVDDGRPSEDSEVIDE